MCHAEKIQEGTTKVFLPDHKSLLVSVKEHEPIKSLVSEALIAVNSRGDKVKA
jgi:hypothetical protein